MPQNVLKQTIKSSIAYQINTNLDGAFELETPRRSAAFTLSNWWPKKENKVKCLLAKPTRLTMCYQGKTSETWMTVRKDLAWMELCSNRAMNESYFKNNAFKLRTESKLCKRFTLASLASFARKTHKLAKVTIKNLVSHPQNVCSEFKRKRVISTSPEFKRATSSLTPVLTHF